MRYFVVLLLFLAACSQAVDEQPEVQEEIIEEDIELIPFVPKTFCNAFTEDECALHVQCVQTVDGCDENPSFSIGGEAPLLCERTNGDWFTDGEVKYCACQKSSPEQRIAMGEFIFDGEFGCASEKALCDGEWKVAQPTVVEQRDNILEENCFSRNEYTIYEWNDRYELCIISRYSDPESVCI